MLQSCVALKLVVANRLVLNTTFIPPFEQKLPLSSRSRRGYARNASIFEVAEARTSGQVNRVFSLQSAFSSASIRLLIKPMVITEPAVPNSGKRAAIRPGFAWVWDCTLEISSACSTKIFLDSYIVFLEYAKIEQSKKGSADVVVLYITELRGFVYCICTLAPKGKF